MRNADKVGKCEQPGLEIPLGVQPQIRPTGRQADHHLGRRPKDNSYFSFATAQRVIGPGCQTSKFHSPLRLLFVQSSRTRINHVRAGPGRDL